MALIAWPADVRITELDVEAWSPGRIVHRARGGALTAPLVRAPVRWRGMVSFGRYGVGGDLDRRAADRIEAFLAQLSDPDHWTEMPFCGDPPFRSTIASAWRGRTTAFAAGLHTLVRTGGGPANPGDPDPMPQVGEWLQYGGGASSRLLQVVTAAGTAADPQITTSPAIAGAGGDLWYPASTMRVRKTEPDDTGITAVRSASWGGDASWAWEEVLR